MNIYKVRYKNSPFPYHIVAESIADIEKHLSSFKEPPLIESIILIEDDVIILGAQE